MSLQSLCLDSFHELLLQSYSDSTAFTSRPRMLYSHLVSNSFCFSKRFLNPLLIAVSFPQTIVRLSLKFDLHKDPSVLLSHLQYSRCHHIMRDSVGITCSCLLLFFLEHQLLLASTKRKGLPISVSSRTEEAACFLLLCLSFSPSGPLEFTPRVEDGFGWIKCHSQGCSLGKCPPLIYS